MDRRGRKRSLGPATLAAAVLLVLSLFPVLGSLGGCSGAAPNGPAGWTILGLDVPNYAGNGHRKLAPEEREWIRHYKLEIRWEKVQPERGAFDWSYYDREIDAVLSDGARSILLLLGGPVPEWARDSAYGTFADKAPPANLDDWRSFCAGVAGRYGEVVDFYEIWNEPGWDRDSEVYDLFGTYHFGGRAETDYLPLLSSAHSAVREADPQGMVVCGSLVDTLKDDPAEGTSLYAYLFGNQPEFSRSCDMIAVHPYKTPGNWGPFYSNLVRTMESVGVEKEIVVTEVGWPHHSDDDPTKFSASQQADAIGDWGLAPLWEAGCRKIWIYKDIDEAPGTSWDNCYYGMFGYDGVPYPSWSRYREWQAANPDYPALPPSLAAASD